MGRKEIVAAAPGANIDFNEYEGKIFVVEPIEVEKDIKTVHGETDAVRANVWVLLGPDEQETFDDALIFPRVLQGQLRRKIGSIVVGRLGQGEKKPGQNAPWILNEPTEKDLKKAKAFLATKDVSGADDDDSADEGKDDPDDAF